MEHAGVVAKAHHKMWRRSRWPGGREVKPFRLVAFAWTFEHKGWLAEGLG